MKKFHERTLEVHAGEMADPVTGARATPIYHTSSYAFESAEKAKKLYNAGEKKLGTDENVFYGILLKSSRAEIKMINDIYTQNIIMIW